MRIFINPGHAQSGDPGACGHGLQESVIAQNIGELTMNLLKAQGADVNLYQVPVDNQYALAEICEASNAWRPDIFISIHCNSAANPAANGTETFSATGSANGAKLANAIHKNILGYIPELTDRGTKTAGFYVLKNTDAVAVLVETAFICNDKDANILSTRQKDFANAIVAGINEYFGQKKTVAEKCPTVGQIVDVSKIAILTHRYESNGDPGIVSSGVGDVGGISYGLYQFSSKMGIVTQFVDWLIEHHPEYGNVLAQHPVNSELFIFNWREFGKNDPQGFGKAQDEFAVEMYMIPAAKLLKNNFFDLDKHSDALKAVVFARAIQNGVTGCSIVFKMACARLGYPNLSYVDDIAFDSKIISAIYDFLVDEADNAQPSGGIYRSANNLVRGSASVIAGQRNRFINEKADALNML